MSHRSAFLVMLASAIVLGLTGCKREERRFSEPASTSAPVDSIRLSQLQAGSTNAPIPVKNSYEENAYAVAQGQRLFTWFNCAGCHSHGGGGMGPALMDDKWIYGSDPQNIFATIVQGRPNGMPSFAGKIPEAQVWQIVAYVRSMSGQLRSDVAPSRSDTMSAGGPENTRDPEPTKPVSEPKPQ
jgi:cytochrome c oxidase cbb3-type subunit III